MLVIIHALALAFALITLATLALTQVESTMKSVADAKATMQSHIMNPNYRIPGYAGLCPGHKQVCGFTHGAICWGEAGRTTYAAIGFDAPGLNAGEQIIKTTNLAPGAIIPAGKPRTKAGYTGHLPGRHFSSNFGKNFMATSEELLTTHGQPVMGGISDPVQPLKPDIEAVLESGPTAWPNRSLEDSKRHLQSVAGYAGFRPRTTPGVSSW